MSYSIDFGAVTNDAIQTKEFTVVNMSKKNIKTKVISSSCGCTNLNIENDEINVNGESIFRLTFNPKGKDGKQEQSITAQLNRGSIEYITFKIKADIQRELVMKPGFVQFEIRDDAVQTKSIQFISKYDKEYKIKSVENNPPYTTNIADGGKLKSGDLIEIKREIDSQKNIGDSIKITLENEYSFEIPIVEREYKPYSISPEVINFVVYGNNAFQTKSASISWNDNKEIQEADLTFTESRKYIQVKDFVIEGNTIKFTVELDSSSIKESEHQKIQVSLFNDKSFDIPVYITKL